MKVSEAIEKLAMKRDDALKFQKLYNPSDVGWSANESKAIAFNIAINTLQKIDEPQAEKINATIVEQAEKAIEFDRLTSKIKMLTGLDVDDFLRELELRGLEQVEKVEVPDWFDQWYKKLIVDCSYHESKALVLINQCGDGHVLENFDGGIFGGTAKNSVIYTGWINSNRELASRAILDGYTVKPKRWVVKRSDGDYVNDYQEATLCVGIDLTSELDVLPPFKFTDKSKAEAVATLIDGSVEEV